MKSQRRQSKEASQVINQDLTVEQEKLDEIKRYEKYVGKEREEEEQQQAKKRNKKKKHD